MINFIICDNNKHILENVTNTINKIMIGSNLAYKTYLFSEYNNAFEKELKRKKSNSVYILDIHVNQISGIDIARKIRKKDQNAIIIFLSQYHHLAELIITEEIMPLTFISKYKNYQVKLQKAINTALSILNAHKHLKLQEKGIHYQIPLKDIMYITHDSVDRKSIVITDYTVFRINRSLSEIFEQLGPEFKYSHRACIVNMERVIKLDMKNKLIVFDNGKTLDLISNNHKKELREYVSNY